jgi:Fe2+ or Zn2+ uptake regulation protein
MEALQNGIAQRYRFKISHHRMELYGRCADCSQERSAHKRKN